MKSLAFLLSSIPFASCAPPSNYSLLWADEFSGSSLGQKRWRYDVGTSCGTPLGCGWGNNEMQTYRRENAVVANGKLVLTAKNEYKDYASFTSARVLTEGLVDFAYGYIEASIKLPAKLGLASAFWLLPTNSPYGDWASSGEIDIMEQKNTDNVTLHTIHYGRPWPNNQYSGCPADFPAATAALSHVYGLEWTKDYIHWFVDGVQVCEKLRGLWFSSADTSDPAAPFNQRFYVIFNLAVGGNFVGIFDPAPIIADWNGTSPTMEIDYVRIYSPTGRTATSSAPAPLPVPGAVLAGSGFVDRHYVSTAGNYLSGPTRNGSGGALVNMVGGATVTYSLNVSAAGSYGVTYSIASGTPTGGYCMADNLSPPVRLFMVTGTDCDGTRYGVLDLLSPPFGPSNGTYRDYVAPGPIIFKSPGQQFATLCIEQAPFLRLATIRFTAAASAKTPAYSPALPGLLYGADFGFTAYKDGYSGPCGPRFERKISEMSAGEQYTYDVNAKAIGSYSVVYSIAAGNPAGVPVSLYVVKGDDCTSTRFAAFEQASVYTGDSYANFVDFAGSLAAPLPIAVKGRQKITLCVAQASYMFLASMNITAT